MKGAHDVRIEPTWEAFRTAARGLLARGVPPNRVRWWEADARSAPLLWDGIEAATGAPEESASARVGTGRLGPADRPSTDVRVPRRYLDLGADVACHRRPAPWPLLYALAYRLSRGSPSLLRDAADPDVSRLLSMQRAVRRDAHKMTAFVRFSRVEDDEGERYVAWYEPVHRILRRTVPFFRRRFPSMRWSILTPDGCAHWDLERLTLAAPVPRDLAPESDDLEAFWLTYYANTFNPARVRVSAMKSEMPVRYWANLPETAAIPRLLREAPARVRAMIEAGAGAQRRAGARQRSGAPQSDGPRRPRGDATRVVKSPNSRAADAGVPDILPPADWSPVRTEGVRIGVAGWDYPDWAGRAYPANRSRVDRLRWIAARFDLVEVNATFYRPAAPRATRRWIQRVHDRPTFRFAAKLLRAFTHERGPWRDADARAVTAGLDPVLEAGRLTALLVQFPWSFRHSAEAVRHLRRILVAFSAFPLCVEVRHRSWDREDVRAWLRERDVSLAAIDQPLFPDSVGPDFRPEGSLAYVRLHGRNRNDWFREDATRDERYDYDYDRAELEDWHERILGFRDEANVEEVAVVFNNHYRAQAVNNAETFARMLASAE